MDWFLDMFWLFIEWFLLLLLAALLGLWTGWMLWRRHWKTKCEKCELLAAELRREHKGLLKQVDEATARATEAEAKLEELAAASQVAAAFGNSELEQEAKALRQEVATERQERQRIDAELRMENQRNSELAQALAVTKAEEEALRAASGKVPILEQALEDTEKRLAGAMNSRAEIESLRALLEEREHRISELEAAHVAAMSDSIVPEMPASALDAEPSATGVSSFREQPEERASSSSLTQQLASFAAERDLDYKDPLIRIQDVDESLAARLQETGVHTFYQLALLSEEGQVVLEQHLGLEPGRVRQKNWASRAAQLHFERHDEDIYDRVAVAPVYADAFERQVAEGGRGRKLDYRDDLKLIRGVGPKMERLLNDFGLTTFLQVSLLDKEGVAALNDRLDFFPGRIERDRWVAQAAQLHEEHHPDVPRAGGPVGAASVSPDDVE